MNIAQWRTGLKNWLQTKLIVDSWELRNPLTYGTINAFLPPLASLSVDDGARLEATGIQDIYLTSKYSGNLKYIDLPLGTWEQLYITLQRKLSSEFVEVAAISDLTMLPVVDAIQISEDGEGLADWLVTLVISCNIRWSPDATLLPGETPTPEFTLKEISTGLFTARLEPSPREIPDATEDFKDATRRDKVGDIKIP